MFIHSAIENATPQTTNGAFSYLIPLPRLRSPPLLLMQLIWVGIMSYCYQRWLPPSALFQACGVAIPVARLPPRRTRARFAVPARIQSALPQRIPAA